MADAHNLYAQLKAAEAEVSELRKQLWVLSAMYTYRLSKQEALTEWQQAHAEEGGDDNQNSQ